MADYALVVGIEQYETARAAPLPGPSLDTLLFAYWLTQGPKLSPNNIILIQNRTEWPARLEKKYGKELAKVRKVGIKIRREPTFSAISHAWRKELLAGPEGEGGTLWLYWSGHGLAFPNIGEAVLCSNNEFNQPSYIYLKEFRDAFRSEPFQRFSRQILIVDACAEYVKPEDLDLKSVRQPESWAGGQTPNQIEFNAVPIGQRAQAEEGGSLFTRLLLRELNKTGWPDDIARLDEAVRAALHSEMKDETKLPRLRIWSPHFEAGFDLGRNAEKCQRLLKVLERCEIPFQSYHPFYLRTVGKLNPDPKIMAAPSLTAMLRELLEFGADSKSADHSLALVEFFERIRRRYKDRAKPIRKWLDAIPPGELLTVRQDLDREAANLVLTIRVLESKLNPNGFPAVMEASLAATAQGRPFQTWAPLELEDQTELEKHASSILSEAHERAQGQKGTRLKVEVLANPVFMWVPWHALRVPSEQFSMFGQFHAFVLRSRARRDRAKGYDLDSWEEKAKALRHRLCSEIALEPAPAWSEQSVEEVYDKLAQVDGLLLFEEPLGPPSDATHELYKLLHAALHKGVALASWPAVLPGTKNNVPPDFLNNLKKLLAEAGSLAQAPDCFCRARKSKAWARQTTLFWDDDSDGAIQVGEEPTIS